MRQLMLDGPADVRWEQVEERRLTRPDQALVRPIAVATCDLDVAVLDGRYPLPGPYPLGHEGIADVLEVGAEVRDVKPGDRVVVPFQISCGACENCRRGRTGQCRAHPWMSAYGLGPIGGAEWGGFLADRVVVPHADAMLVPLPPGLDPVAVASASDNIPDAWRTVGPPLEEEPGANVLVVNGGAGAPSIGLYAVGIAKILGAGAVTYVDQDAERLKIAEAFGADVVEGPAPEKAGSFPVSVDTSGSKAGLRCAVTSTAPDGVCTSAAIYAADVPLPMFSMYSRGITFRTGRVHARATLPEVLDVIGRGFEPERVTTRVVSWDDAADALASAAGKLVITRD